MRRFEGKLVVITGAAGGIGSALARAFAGRGARLALIDLDAQALAALAETLTSTPVSTHVTNVGDPAALAEARTQILAEHGRVDVLINNAGVTVFAEFEATTAAEIERVLDVNVRGVIHGCRTFLPDLRAQDEAHIVNVSSMAALSGMPWQTLYCASKFAIRGFTASLRSELAGKGVGVTCLMPGTTRSNIVGAAASRNPALRDQLSHLLVNYGYPPDWLARKLLRAIRWNRAELQVGPDSALLAGAVRVSPMLVRASMRMLVGVATRRGLTAVVEDPPR